ncbi:hypothetical protein [Nocardia farcinica]|uniref:hypothetical protein n=1 Tax=Nocardia farcinica TaxID=37329 RepID=UPI00189510F7|nr:hypothetical protein [Nocardia farcinica]MBF6519267.1 hypothetical protein [Nocardia farcinica]
MIVPVIPPQSPFQELIHGPAAAPPLVRTANPEIVYGLCTLGESGRVLDRHIYQVLVWEPGTRLSLTYLDSGVLLAVPDPDGATPVTDGGFFRIPFRLRRRAGMAIGDRTLLITHRTHRRLLIHPPAVLDEMCASSVRLAELELS